MTDLQGDSDPRTVTYEYDIVYNVIKETDSLGNVTTTEYEDPRHPNLATSRTSPNLDITKWTYNKLGNVTSVIDAQGNQTDFEYAEDVGPSGDQYRNLIRKVKRPTVSGAPSRFETNFSYDSLGRLETVTDAKDQETSFAYGSFGVVESVTDRRGITTTYDYDPSSLRLLEVSVPTGRSTGALSTTFDYDGFDQVTKVYNALGDFVETSYDDAGRPETVWDISRTKTEFRYEDGLLQEIDLPANSASGSAARTTRMSYDSAARLTEVERAIGGSGFESRVSYGFDGFSQLRELNRLKDMTTQTFEFEYDNLGRQTQVTDPLGKSSTTLYEPYCKRFAETTARGVRRKMSFARRSCSRRSRYRFGPPRSNLCRLTQVDVGDPGSGFSVMNKRETRTFEYDELGRLLKSRQGKSSSSLGSARYGHTNYGETVDVSGDGGVREYQYDELDRILQVTFEDDSTISYEYDEESNLLTMTETASATVGSPDPRITSYQYYDDSLLKKVIVKRSGQSDRVFEYFYDALGRPERIAYPDETMIEVLFDDGSSNSGWDQNGRLTHLRYENDGTPVRSFEFGYDSSGNRILQIDTTPTGSVRWEYEYDWFASRRCYRRSRLTVVKKGINGGSVVTVSVYTYDESEVLPRSGIIEPNSSFPKMSSSSSTAMTTPTNSRPWTRKSVVGPPSSPRPSGTIQMETWSLASATTPALSSATVSMTSIS